MLGLRQLLTVSFPNEGSSAVGTDWETTVTGAAEACANESAVPGNRNAFRVSVACFVRDDEKRPGILLGLQRTGQRDCETDAVNGDWQSSGGPTNGKDLSKVVLS